jgi:hypothetical protein
LAHFSNTSKGFQIEYFTMVVPVNWGSRGNYGGDICWFWSRKVYFLPGMQVSVNLCRFEVWKEDFEATR